MFTYAHPKACKDTITHVNACSPENLSCQGKAGAEKDSGPRIHIHTDKERGEKEREEINQSVDKDWMNSMGSWEDDHQVAVGNRKILDESQMLILSELK